MTTCEKAYLEMFDHSTKTREVWKKNLTWVWNLFLL